MNVVILDYGMGNVASVQKAFNYLKIESTISNQPNDIQAAKYIVLPGVGAFKQGMDNLKKHGLVDILNHQVLIEKKPFLGICLGMQLIAKYGTEPEDCEGLGWINGTIKKMEEPDKRIPHLGWNQITTKNDGFIKEFDQKDFYFIHSYHFDIENKEQIAAKVNYGNNYVAAIQHENIFAVQFHPEKSQEAGLHLVNKFFQYYA